MAGNDMPDKPDGLFAQIAKKHCRVETLEIRNRDSLDFHEVSVWGLKAALEEAFAAGAAHQLAQSKAAAHEKAGHDSSEKTSVMDRIREVAKAPKEPHKNKTARDKSGPEL